jgi:ribosome-binding ATPase
MKLSIGIVGLPNVGKSTLFKALTKNDITIANYPFATIDPNVGVVSVPDERLDKLAELSESQNKIPAIVEFYDIAGLVRGANKGEGLGNQFLTHIRNTSAICMVLRCFKSDDIIHVEDDVDPVRDLEIINTELILKDFETVEKRLASAEKEAKSGDKKASAEVKELEIIKVGLLKGKLVRQIAIETNHHKELNLLTAKKQLFLLNGKDSDITDKLKSAIEELGGGYVIYDLSDLNVDLTKLIRKTYEILDLISFFTTGEKETRAWTIRKGAKAPEAAGTIHTDFQNKFIRAEVINWEKLLEAESWSKAKARGWIKLEGKDYVVKDGDTLIIHHS